MLEWLSISSRDKRPGPGRSILPWRIGPAGSVMLILWIALGACSVLPAPPPAGTPAAQRSMPPAPSDPAQPDTALPAIALPPILFTIQVGAFSTLERAAQETVRLQQAGLDAYFFQDEDQLYKVRFERFDTLDAARERAMELQSDGQIDSFFIARPGPDAVAGDPVTFLRENIILTVHRFVGVPYRWGGESESDGFDCSGLTMIVYRLNGFELPRSALGQYRTGMPVNKDALEPGDLVFFATGRSSNITHVGIYSGRDHFIHAPGRGKTIQTASLDSDYFKKRYVGARRYF
jgi:hypothetical protein